MYSNCCKKVAAKKIHHDNVKNTLLQHNYFLKHSYNNIFISVFGIYRNKNILLTTLPCYHIVLSQHYGNVVSKIFVFLYIPNTEINILLQECFSKQLCCSNVFLTLSQCIFLPQGFYNSLNKYIQRFMERNVVKKLFGVDKLTLWQRCTSFLAMLPKC